MTPLFTAPFLERVRKANRIQDVITEAFGPLHKVGGELMLEKCFLCGRRASFFVHPNYQIYHCFSCHAGGDVFRFVQLSRDISFKEAVIRLANRAEIRMPGTGKGKHPHA
jgi:DNA primase